MTSLDAAGARVADLAPEDVRERLRLRLNVPFARWKAAVGPGRETWEQVLPDRERFLTELQIQVARQGRPEDRLDVAGNWYTRARALDVLADAAVAERDAALAVAVLRHRGCAPWTGRRVVRAVADVPAVRGFLLRSRSRRVAAAALWAADPQVAAVARQRYARRGPAADALRAGRAPGPAEVAEWLGHARTGQEALAVVAAAEAESFPWDAVVDAHARTPLVPEVRVVLLGLPGAPPGPAAALTGGKPWKSGRRWRRREEAVRRAAVQYGLLPAPDVYLPPLRRAHRPGAGTMNGNDVWPVVRALTNRVVTARAVAGRAHPARQVLAVHAAATWQGVTAVAEVTSVAEVTRVAGVAEVTGELDAELRSALAPLGNREDAWTVAATLAGDFPGTLVQLAATAAAATT